MACNTPTCQIEGQVDPRMPDGSPLPNFNAGGGTAPCEIRADGGRGRSGRGRGSAKTVAGGFFTDGNVSTGHGTMPTPQIPFTFGGSPGPSSSLVVAKIPELPVRQPVSVQGQTDSAPPLATKPIILDEPFDDLAAQKVALGHDPNTPNIGASTMETKPGGAVGDDNDCYSRFLAMPTADQARVFADGGIGRYQFAQAVAFDLGNGYAQAAKRGADWLFITFAPGSPERMEFCGAVMVVAGSFAPSGAPMLGSPVGLKVDGGYVMPRRVQQTPAALRGGSDLYSCMRYLSSLDANTLYAVMQQSGIADGFTSDPRNLGYMIALYQRDPAKATQLAELVRRIGVACRIAQEFAARRPAGDVTNPAGCLLPTGGSGSLNFAGECVASLSTPTPLPCPAGQTRNFYGNCVAPINMADPSTFGGGTQPIVVPTPGPDYATAVTGGLTAATDLIGVYLRGESASHIEEVRSQGAVTAAQIAAAAQTQIAALNSQTQIQLAQLAGQRGLTADPAVAAAINAQISALQQSNQTQATALQDAANRATAAVAAAAGLSTPVMVGLGLGGVVIVGGVVYMLTRPKSHKQNSARHARRRRSRKAARRGRKAH